MLPEVCKDVQAKMREKFADVLKSGEDGSDPIYIVASCLDPPVARALCILDEKLDICLPAIKNMV